MEPHLFLKRGKKRILLVRYDERLYFVTLDHRMHLKVRAWFLEQPRTDAEMDERNLIRTVIAVKDIRGVAVGGTGRGHMIQFYLKEGKRRCELDEDCTAADLEILFHGLESFSAPKQKSNWQDPRLSRQDPRKRKELYILGMGLNALSVGSCMLLGIWGFESAPVCIGSGLCIAADFVLYCMYPDYFTIFMERRKYGERRPVMWLVGAVLCPLVMIGALWKYCYFEWWRAWAIGAGIVAVLAVVLCLTTSVFRDSGKLAAVVLAGLLLSGGPVMALNTLLDKGPARQADAQIVDMHIVESSKRGDRYELTVVLDGRERDIPVASSVYAEAKAGEWISLEVHEGGFGIAYAHIESE